jgi:hypothetical protein
VKKKGKNPNQNALRPHDYPGGFFGCAVESPDASGDPKLSHERKVGSLLRSAGEPLLRKPKRGEKFSPHVEGRSVAELDGLEKPDRHRLATLMRRPRHARSCHLRMSRYLVLILVFMSWWQIANSVEFSSSQLQQFIHNIRKVAEADHTVQQSNNGNITLNCNCNNEKESK